MNSFSVVIVTYKRGKLLQRCLQSVVPHQKEREFPIFVVINGNDSDSLLLLRNSFPNVNIIQSKKVNPGEARNLATKQIDTDYIFFLDDDTILPFDYFEQISEIFSNNKNLSIFGGPDANYPNSKKWGKALSMALMSPLATANTRFRHITGTESNLADSKKLILCNMWVKNSLFKEGLYFDPRFFRNEENVFIHSAESKGHSIKYFPKLFVYHKRRDSIYGLFRAVMLSGAGRLRSFFFYPSSVEAIYFVPFLFSTYVIGLILFDFGYLYKIPFILYLILNFYHSWKLTKRNRNSLFLVRVSVIQFIINFAYGIGFYLEFVNRLIPNLKSGKKPRPE